MANAHGEAVAISVAEMVQQDEVSVWARLALARLTQEPTEPATEEELVMAIEKEHEPNKASDAPGSQRWRALDQLLRASFALISPRLPLQLVSSAPIGATSLWRAAETAVPQLPANQLSHPPLSWRKAMDCSFKKLRTLIIRAGEQILVASVLAFYLIVIAMLTIPDSLSLTSLSDLVWDQFSTPSPHAPAGDVTFKLLKIWADHLIDVEIPRIRKVSTVAGQIFAACALENLHSERAVNHSVHLD